MDIDDLLTIEATQVYRWVLANPDRPQRDAAAAMPEINVSEAFSSLAQLHLVRSSFEDPDRWVAISPDAASTRVLAEREAHIQAMREEVAETKLGMSRLMSDYMAVRSLRNEPSRIEYVEGTEAIRSLLEDLAELVETRVWSMTPGNRMGENAISHGLPLDLAALARGVQFRTLVQHTARQHVPTTRYLRTIMAAGAEVCSVALLPTRMLIIDSYAVISETSQVGSAAYFIRDTRVLRLAEMLFESTWSGALDLEEPEAVGAGDRPSDLHLAILRGLADGHKDETIARQLGVSIRTLRRQIADLMEALDVETRFQAGLAAGRGGWI